MGQRSAPTIKARNGLLLVGLAVFTFGLIQGGVGLAQYKRPNLGTSIKINNAAAVKDAAFHDMAVGAAAITVGAFIGFVGLARARRDQRNALRPHVETTRIIPANTIDLTTNGRLEPLPIGVSANLSPIARRVWDCRLAVDLQQQRLMNEGIGAESRIDAELYMIALRNLVRAVKSAQATTRSPITWEALTTFGRIGGAPEEFLAEVERTSADDGSAGPVGLRFGESGTEIVIGSFAVKVETISAAADALANATVGDLTDIRSRVATKKRTRRVPVSTNSGAKD